MSDEVVITYWFKPNGHWNVVSEKVYNELSRFYEPEFLKIEEKQKEKK